MRRQFLTHNGFSCYNSLKKLATQHKGYLVLDSFQGLLGLATEYCIIFFPLTLNFFFPRTFRCFHHNFWSCKPFQTYKIGEHTWGKKEFLPNSLMFHILGYSVCLCAFLLPLWRNTEWSRQDDFTLNLHHNDPVIMVDTYLTSVQSQDQVKFTDNFTVRAFTVKLGSEP